MEITKIMTKQPITITEDKTVKDAAKLMCDKRISALPVLNKDGDVVGIITESDFVGKEVEVPHAMVKLKQAFGHNLNFTQLEKTYEIIKEVRVGEVMTRNVKSLTEETDLEGYIQFMIEKHIKRVPVIKDNKLVGIVTRKDIIKSFL
ncbi:CBS domain-containing protein [Halobacteriovorax sp. GFR7]|uniref:CBS domain-containing protein n=1 Tax=unclassified Halobacteriovorax TaxID=2639665 RepID=UPI003D983127